MKNFKKISIALTCALCVILIACSASLVMLLVNGARPGLLDSNGNFTTEASGARLGKTYDYGEAYVDGIIFVGDSTISSISGTSLLRDKNQVWSCADGTLPLDYNASTTAVVYSEDGKSATVSAAAQLQKPQYMIITIGIENGVAHCSEEKFKEYYSKLVSSVKAASPETKIILQSIFPTSKQVSKETPNISNEKISRANAWVEDVAESLSVKYLDTASILVDKDGNLLSEYDSGDGIHLNEHGFSAVLNYIRTHGYR